MTSSFRTHRSGPLVACILAYSAALLVAYFVWQQVSDLHIIYAALAADIAATFVIFLAGTMLKNSSLYDPYWSAAPPILALFYLSQSGLAPTNHLRGGIVFFLVIFWAGRLTFNCFRRWQNLEHEDFRYVDFRKTTGAVYPFVDLFGIQLFPTILVFLGCLPLYPIFAEPARALNALDLIALIVLFGALVVEAVADEQLTQFKQIPHEKGQVFRGGLWAWSRHPNYLGEIGFWWGLWLFALASNTMWWWTGVGALAITILFVFISIPMIERRKSASRPDYDTQVKNIPKIFFKPPR